MYAPMNTPITVSIVATKRASSIELLVPVHVLVHISRPRASVPTNGALDVGSPRCANANLS